MPTGHPCVFCGETSIKVVCPFFDWVVCFFVVLFVWVVYIFWKLSPCLSHHCHIICKYFILFHMLSFQHLGVFCATFYVCVRKILSRLTITICSEQPWCHCELESGADLTLGLIQSSPCASDSLTISK